LSVKKRGGGHAGGDAGARGLTVKVKKAKKLKPSSVRWLQRQLNDPYVEAAQKEGYRSRAAYKLTGLDDRFHFLKPGMAIIDLGAAPGGWTQVCVQRTKADRPGTKSRIVAIDLLEIDPIPGAEIFQLDFMADEAPAILREKLGRPADAVLSDMAPSTIGHANTDHIRIMGLVEAALDFAVQVLAPDGVFVAKVFQGGAEGEALNLMKRAFKTVRHAKPPASRAESAEMFVIATGFRGLPESR